MTGRPTRPSLPATALAEQVPEDRVMDPGIRPLWAGMPAVTGPVHAVRCAPGDNLMMHAAVYRTAPGSVIVVDAGGSAPAVAGGNVCAVAQRRGIAGFVVDGNIRDVAEARELGFPIFARGVFPKPGTKKGAVSQEDVRVGGVAVRTGDVIVADEEGVVVVPADAAEEAFAAAQAKAATEGAMSLDEWEADHRRKVEAGLAANEDTEPLPR